MGCSNISAKTVCSILLFMFVLYWAHRMLQLQHYRHCRADLFRVVLFSQSSMCTHIATLLHVVEMMYRRAIKLLATQALGTLGGGMLSESLVAMVGL
jgi:hypothetical protein